jgi:hypothetical protein
MSDATLDILVIRQNSSIQLRPDHVGGNRLRVLCDVHRQRLKTEDVEKVGQEIVHICVNDYFAKFLEIKAGGAFGELSSTEIDVLIRNLLLEQVDSSTGSIQEGPSTTTSSSMNSSDENDAQKKRPRRSSLLRRSINEDGTSLSMKKSLQILRTQFSFTSRQEAPSSAEAPMELTSDQLEPLDVLFDATQSALVTCTDSDAIDDSNSLRKESIYPGNNRLQVLCCIQQQPFCIATEDDRKATIEEMYRTVTESWGGRFLAHTSQGVWHVMTETVAKEALTCLLDPELSKAITQTATSTSAERRRTSFLKSIPANFAIFSSLPRPGSDMRSAAVASLQRQKKRQGLTSKIRTLATRVFTRNQRDDNIKKQRDRFAEANFDTTPPMSMNMMSAPATDDMDYYYGASSTRRGSLNSVNSTSSLASGQLMPPPPPRNRALDSSSSSYSDEDDLYGNQGTEEEEDDDDGGMLGVLQRHRQQAMDATAAPTAQPQNDDQLSGNASPDAVLLSSSTIRESGISQPPQTPSESSNGPREQPSTKSQTLMHSQHQQLQASDSDSATNDVAAVPNIQELTSADAATIDRVERGDVIKRSTGSERDPLDEGHLNELLTGLDVSGSDLNYQHTQSDKSDTDDSNEINFKM